MNKHVLSFLACVCIAGLYGCTLEEAVVCGPGTHMIRDQKVCEPDSKTVCGPSSFDCTSLSHVEDVSCILVDSVSLCAVEKCSEGYVLISGTFDQDGNSDKDGMLSGYCTAEDIHHCGESDVDCEKEKPERADKVVCDASSHRCKIETCLSERDDIREVKFSGDWLNQCVEVTDYACIEQYCQGDEFANADTFSCDKARKGAECKIVSCKMGYYLDDGKCLANTDENCGQKEFNCHDYENKNHISKMKCSSDGQCVIAECDNDSVLKDMVCEEIEVECKMDEDCTELYKNKEFEGIEDVQCEANHCRIMSCQDGYRLGSQNGGYICIEQTLTDCSPTFQTYDCTDIDGFNHALDGACVDGVCTATMCEDGYHVQTGSFSGGVAYTTCEPDDAQKCGANPVNCKDVVEHSVQNDCIDGVCHVVQCEVGWHPNPDDNYQTCVKDNTNACGQKALNCISENVSTAKCNDGVCEVVCRRGTHPNKEKTACVVNSKTECGENRDDCTKIANSVDVSCEDGQCMVLSCQEGYGPTPDRTKCAQDTVYSCGGISTNCKRIGDGTCQNGRCVYTSCHNSEGYYKNGTDCCKNQLHIKTETYVNNDISCVGEVTMESNVKNITLNALRTVNQIQTCAKPIGMSGDSTDEYTLATGSDSNVGVECKASLQTLNLPNLEKAHGLFILNSNNLELKLYSIQNIDWLYGGAKSLFAPMLKALGGDLDKKLYCDVDFGVKSLYTPRLKSINLINDCIYLAQGYSVPIDWVYPENITGFVYVNSECIDMVVNPFPKNLCLGFQENCTNDLGCAE